MLAIYLTIGLIFSIIDTYSIYKKNLGWNKYWLIFFFIMGILIGPLEILNYLMIVFAQKMADGIEVLWKLIKGRK